jgi:hypothetical protein
MTMLYQYIKIIIIIIIIIIMGNPNTGLWGPEGPGSLRLPDSVTSALEGGRLSALCTSRLYPQENPGTHF